MIWATRSLVEHDEETVQAGSRREYRPGGGFTAVNSWRGTVEDHGQSEIRYGAAARNGQFVPQARHTPNGKCNRGASNLQHIDVEIPPARSSV